MAGHWQPADRSPACPQSGLADSLGGVERSGFKARTQFCPARQSVRRCGSLRHKPVVVEYATEDGQGDEFPASGGRLP